MAGVNEGLKRTKNVRSRQTRFLRASIQQEGFSIVFAWSVIGAIYLIFLLKHYQSFYLFVMPNWKLVHLRVNTVFNFNMIRDSSTVSNTSARVSSGFQTLETFETTRPQADWGAIELHCRSKVHSKVESEPIDEVATIERDFRKRMAFSVLGSF